jgi:hypothetical protein
MSAGTTKRPRLVHRRSDSSLSVPAAPFKLSWSANEPPVIKEYQSVDEFLKHVETAEKGSPHECFWLRSVQQALHTPNSSNLRKWKLVQNQIAFMVYARAFGDKPLAAAMIISSAHTETVFFSLCLWTKTFRLLFTSKFHH